MLWALIGPAPFMPDTYYRDDRLTPKVDIGFIQHNEYIGCT